MSTMIAILGIVLVISGVAYGHASHDHHGHPHPSLKYDRRGLEDGGGGGGGGGANVVDISKCPGAKGDGASDSTEGIMKAWNDVCNAKVQSKLVIPEGTWLHGELDWRGPCSAPQPIIVDLQGTLKAKPDAKSYPNNVHISVYSVSVQFVGGGTIDGNGKDLQAKREKDDKCLPDSLSFMQCPNSAVTGIKFINAKGFNLKVVACDQFKIHGVSITCAADTLNTDGIHIARCTGASIIDTLIQSGDDCISIGDATCDLTVRNIQCGPGHGISIGSLGKFPDEKDVKNLEISNVTFTNTDNGVRIKTFADSPPLAVTNVTFSDITLKDVLNPILIDQHYTGGHEPTTKETSKVKISGITYKNIKGTTLSNLAIALNCSGAAPCEGITVENVQLTYSGKDTVDKGIRSVCLNAKAKFVGSNPACE